MSRNRVSDIMRILFGGQTTPDQVRQAIVAALSDIAGEIQDLRQQEATLRILQDSVPTSTPAKSEPRPTVADDGLTPEQRSRLVRETALELAHAGHVSLSVADILDSLERKGRIFSIKRPGSMVGTILAGMREFERVEMGIFRFRGNGVQPLPFPEQQSDTEDRN